MLGLILRKRATSPVNGLVLGSHVQRVCQCIDLFDDARGRNAVLAVVLCLDLSATVGLVYGPAHRLGHLVGIHDDTTVHIARSAADGLNQRVV